MLKKYISVDEYLMGKCELKDLPDDIIANINTLIPKVNELLEYFGEYRKINSGYRTKEDQIRINPKAPNSKHCIGAAVDLSDKDVRLYAWIKANPQILEQLDLYCEERQGNWQHIQCLPPKSKKRWFNP